VSDYFFQPGNSAVEFNECGHESNVQRATDKKSGYDPRVVKWQYGATSVAVQPGSGLTQRPMNNPRCLHDKKSFYIRVGDSCQSKVGPVLATVGGYSDTVSAIRVPAIEPGAGVAAAQSYYRAAITELAGELARA
jgi:hypothetical protein